MRNRAANATIKGYYYQFDKTLLEVFSGSDTAQVTVEGIEDIDIKNITADTLIQCKYLASKKYAPSELRGAIIYMLDHFVKGARNVNYKLYAYFGDGSSQTMQFDLTNLKNLLTHKANGKTVEYFSVKNITDEQLNGFLSRFTYEAGLEFDDQHGKLIQKIAEALKCGSDDAKEFYYSKSLQVISELAIKKSQADRKIVKKELVGYLSKNKTFLFNKWVFELKGERDYARLIKDLIKNCDGLHTQKSKLIYLDKTCVGAATNSLNFENFVLNILRKHYVLNKHLKGTEPFTIVLDMQKKDVLRFKKKLLKKEVKFNDGFEHIEFNAKYFNESPVINQTKSGKISQSSFFVKILSRETYMANKKRINEPDVAFFFSMQNPTGYFNSDICVIQINPSNLEGVCKFINN